MCALIVVGLTLAFTQRRHAGEQTRPRRATGSATASTASVILKAGDNLQAALDRAQPGDTILLEAGATFRGAFNLPRKPSAGDAFVTIRSAAPDAQLPAPGERLDPARYAALLPKIVSDERGAPAINAAAGAHHYRFMFVEFGPTPEGVGNIVALGSGQERTPEELPHHIEFDRVYLHGHPTHGQRRGIALNARAVRIVNSHFSDFKRTGDESQAICGWGGDGPFEITNNYIEASSEGVLFGGAAPRMSIVPSDIVVRDNHFNKPLNWLNENWVIKNHFELKNARRVVVDHNLMTNNWAGGQDGAAVLFTTRAEDGASPHVTIEDVQFVNNVVRGSGAGLNIYGAEGRGGHRLTIRNNLFEDIGGARWRGEGYFMKVTEWDGLTVENNTIINTGNITKAYGKPILNFVFRNNIVPLNEYGFQGDGQGDGAGSLNTYFPGGVVVNNAIIGGRPERTGARNVYPATLAQVRFVNPAGGDYRLRDDSPLRRAGGADIGANPLKLIR